METVMVRTEDNEDKSAVCSDKIVWYGGART